MAVYKVKGKEPSINKIYAPPEPEQKVRQHVYDRKQQMSDKRSEEDVKWDLWMKAWDGYRRERGKDDWKSNIVVPLTSSVVEAELSELINQELKPWVLARGAEDEGKASVMNAIIDYTWDQAKSDVALFQIIKDALIFGTGIGQEYFWRQPRIIKGEDGKEKKVTEFDDPYLEPVKLEDFYVDEKARAFSGPYGARDCIRRYIMDYDDFRDFFTGDMDPNGRANLVKPGGDVNYYEFYSPPERVEHSHEVEVLWYWNKPDDLLAIVANDIVVKFGPNPYKHKQLPFVRVIDILKNHSFYGKEESELLESLQDETNTLRRMLVDRNHLDIDKPILVSDTLTMEDEDAITRPHGIIPVGDVNAAKVLEYRDVPLSFFKSLELLNDDKIRVTGMDERQQSVNQAGTATEAAILKEATLKRLGMKIWQIKNDTLVDLGRLRVANIMQFYSRPKLEEIIGESSVAKAEANGTLVKKDGKNYEKKYRTIRLQDQKVQMNSVNQPEVVPTKGISFFEAEPKFFLPTHGGYDIRYKATSSIPISKPLEQQKSDEMYDRLIQNPSVDPWKLAEFLIKSRDKDPDNFKVQQQGQGQDPGMDQTQGLQKQIDIAGTENEEMLRGNPIGATPYASPAHTEVHIEFMKSQKFKDEVKPEDEKTIQIFTDHVTGEITAQTAREGGQGAEGAMSTEGGQMAPGGPPSASAPPNMRDVVPGRMQGGGEVPNGIQGANSGVQVGRKV